jgi:hypothetical protein
MMSEMLMSLVEDELGDRHHSRLNTAPLEIDCEDTAICHQDHDVECGMFISLGKPQRVTIATQYPYVLLKLGGTDEIEPLILDVPDVLQDNILKCVAMLVTDHDRQVPSSQRKASEPFGCMNGASSSFVLRLLRPNFCRTPIVRNEDVWITKKLVHFGEQQLVDSLVNHYLAQHSFVLLLRAGLQLVSLN